MRLSGRGYIASHGETFDSIALMIFGDEKYAADLLQANPELDGILVMQGGEVVKLPIVDTSSNGDYVPQIAPWKVG